MRYLHNIVGKYLFSFCCKFYSGILNFMNFNGLVLHRFGLALFCFVYPHKHNVILCFCVLCLTDHTEFLFLPYYITIFYLFLVLKTFPVKILFKYSHETAIKHMHFQIYLSYCNVNLYYRVYPLKSFWDIKAFTICMVSYFMFLVYGTISYFVKFPFIIISKS